MASPGDEDKDFQEADQRAEQAELAQRCVVDPGVAVGDHPEDAAAYERLKQDLADRHPRDTYSYTIAKTAFIREIEARALVSP